MITKNGKGVFGGVAFGKIKIYKDKREVKRSSRISKRNPGGFVLKVLRFQTAKLLILTWFCGIISATGGGHSD